MIIAPAQKYEYSEYDLDQIAKFDWPAAIKFILGRTKADKVQALVHCVGSMTLLMALLSGMDGVRSVICSQLTVHPVTTWQNYLKSDVDLINILRRWFGISEIDLRSSPDDEAKILDVWLWNLPISAGEECNNPVCRRVSGIFGPSYAHRQLNQATHNALADMFGRATAKPLEHISAILREGRVVDSKGRDIYLPNVGRLRLPITFVAGGRNQLFYPETSIRSFEWLREQNKDVEELYQHHVFPDYGHMDFFIGKKAHEDIFPFITATLEEYEQHQPLRLQTH